MDKGVCPRTAFKAYLAGFLDADGCITVVKQNSRKRGRVYTYYVPTVIISNTRKFLLEEAQAFYDGLGFIATQERGGQQADMNHWRISGGAGVARVLHDVLPHLRIKRDQAELCLRAVEIQQDRLRAGNRSYTPDQLAELDRIVVGISEAKWSA